MPALADYKEDFALLTEAGFVAVSQMDEDAAGKLFAAATLLDDASVLPQIGLAAVALNKLETKKAIGLLEDVIRKEPENHRAGVLLGIALILSGQDIGRGEKLLQKAMEKADDEPTKRLGELWLEVLDKSVQKTEGPASPKKAQEMKEIENEDDAVGGGKE